MRRGALVTAWTLWVFDVLVVTAAFVARPGPVRLADVTGCLFIVVFATTGSLVIARVPHNPAGWLMSLAANAFVIGGLSTVVYTSTHAGGPRAAATIAAWVGTWIWIVGIAPAATILLLLFPDGHLPSPRWRPVVWLTTTALCVMVVGLAFAPGLIDGTDVSNPVGFLTPALTKVLSGVGLALMGISIALCLASLVVRYLHAGQEQRQQLKWLAWAVPVVAAFLLASAAFQSNNASAGSVDVGNALSAVGLTVVPIAIALAILRSRLWDIDVVINRTLVYATLTVSLAAVYLTSVLLLRLAIEPLTGKSDLAVAMSTLAVAALFRPLRSRIQTVVDRRFYRRRYDASLTLQSFTGRLRQEVDLETVTNDLRSVVLDTMHPAHVTLWLRRQP